VTLDADTSYRALCTRDVRFDGVFFVGVTTTGIYCRPVCRARTPRRDRCVFFDSAAAAEREGFRACFRCRPELAPGNGSVDAVPRLVGEAVRRIAEGALNDGSVDALAGSLGVTGRHLRRALVAELGVSPVELAQTERLALAKRLLQDSSLGLAELAYAAGFKSVRRFNSAFRARFGRSPTLVRRQLGLEREPAASVRLRLDFRPPLAWSALLGFLGARAIPGVERVGAGVYRRSVSLGGRAGWVGVALDASRPTLVATVSSALLGGLMPLVARLRRLFDLDARPADIDGQLGRDPALRRLVHATPGLRVPGAFDGFETAVRTVLGQQVTVRGATTLAGRLAERFGVPVKTPLDGVERLFPTPARLAAATHGEIAALGMPGARAQALLDLSRAVEAGLELEPGAAAAETMARLGGLPGFGDWTTQVVAMRALRWPDAFPAADLGVLKALRARSAKAALARAEAWRPWRAYATMYLWSGGGDT